MRKVMWAAMGFACGCAVGVWLFGGIALLILSWLFMCGGFMLYYVGPEHVRKRIAGCLAVGLAFGLFWMWFYEVTYLNTAKAHDSLTVPLTIEITDYGYETYQGENIQGKVSLNGDHYDVKVYLDAFYGLKPGDRVDGAFKMRYTGIRGENSPTYHQGKGILLLAYSEDEPRITRQDQVPGKYFAPELRHTLLENLNRIFPEDTAGFAGALLLGDSSGLTETDDKAFQNSGIRHIIAVSGLHVSILFTVLLVILGRKRILCAVVGLPVLFLFAAIAGFTPSVVRACVMQAIMIISNLLLREYDSPTALSVAVILILIFNPLAITAVGFQLSVGCVAGILLFSGRIHRYLLDRLPKSWKREKTIRRTVADWVIQSVSVSLGAMALTTPLSAYYFGGISLVSVFTNLLTLWAVTFAFCGILLACLLSFVWTWGAGAVAWSVSWLMRYILIVARLFSAIPYSNISADNPYILMWMVFVYVALGILMFLKEKKPLIMLGSIAITLVFSLLLLGLEPEGYHFQVTVLDVGQGQCVILQSADDCYLVDCGGDYGSSTGDLAAQNLRSQNITQVDGLILSHYDSDHTGGATSLLAQMETACVYLPDAEDHNGIRSEFTQSYPQLLQFVTEKTVLPCGEGTITIFPGEKGKGANASSLCILFQLGNCDILITGDRSTSGERLLMEQEDLPKLEILLAGHHGSTSSTGAQLLQETDPEIVVISVGRDNRYGHPTPETLRRLAVYGCRVMRTDQAGTIIFRG